jgi:hypothetical protein
MSEPRPEPSLRVAWELMRLSEAGLLSLEERGSRIVPAQVAGLVALWTTLHNFSGGAPKSLAWAGWAVLLVSIATLAPLLAPRRVARFWGGLVPDDLVATSRVSGPEAEAALVGDIAQAMETQMGRLRRAVSAGIVLALFALFLVALGYVIQKA